MSIQHTMIAVSQGAQAGRVSGLYDRDLRNRHIELRRRFQQAGSAALNDAEMLELLLLHSMPRQDTAPMAQRLIATFGTLQAVFNADPARLEKLTGAVAASDLQMIAAASQRCTRQRIDTRCVISSWDAVLEYCRSRLAHIGQERFHVLFLDRGNRLIADEEMGRGTVDHVPVYPRELLKRALELNASAIILVHNHPSGDPTPSASDIAMTKQIRASADALSITLHDHLIIGADHEISMVSEGLI